RPVFGAARARARRTACTNNLRQIGQAVQMYLQDYEKQRPFELAALAPKYGASAELLACPSDPHRAEGGWMGSYKKVLYPTMGEPADYPTSYGDWSLLYSNKLWRYLERQSGRPGYVVCVTHGERPERDRPPFWYTGPALRLCFDGGVVAIANQPSRPLAIDHWGLLTGQKPSERPAWYESGKGRS
ncbi:MAG: DUF1559 domain-containing protein, partial [Armatimonadetes bacterium]|nr:DUF1559 domain-containing protein [Armatimonadota bacterium]